MRVLAATLVLFLIGSSSLTYTEPSTWSTPFDQYGEINWEDEKARLDNFAIQLSLQDWTGAGAILIFDKSGGCPGEAQARAIRTKRYLVEYRRIPWNRVFWRREGYQADIQTTLLIVPEGAYAPYPFREPNGPQVDGPMTRACKAKLEKIRRSRW